MTQIRRNNPDLMPNGKDDFSCGLVLGGGGSKGCYHVGVWQAMNEYGVHFDAVSGTSIGALVGIFYPGNNIEPVTDFVLNMEPDHIAAELPYLPTTFKETVHGTRTIVQFLRKYYETRMDIEPLREHFRTMFNYESFHDSPVRFACMTYNETRSEPEAFYKGQITAENAEDIVMASSACYPAFPKVEMNGQVYMDGMYADNVPVELCRQILPEAKRYVVVDLHDPGEPLPPALTDDMFYIQPLIKPGHPLDFSTGHAERLYAQGYLDTRRYLGLNPGYLYTFNTADKDLMDVVERYMAAQFTRCNVLLPHVDNAALQVWSGLLGYEPAWLPSPYMENYEFGQLIEALALLARMESAGYYDYRSFLLQIVQRLSSPAEVRQDEFYLVEKLRTARREESIWLFYKAIKQHGGHLPEAIATLKERFPVSYILAHVRYFLEVLVEQLPKAQEETSKREKGQSSPEFVPALPPKYRKKPAEAAGSESEATRLPQVPDQTI